MFPSQEFIRIAAYHRWQKRGGCHGHDRDDWAAAEQEMLFALNYEVIARYRLDGIGPQVLGEDHTPRCRFCEQAAPRATFSGPVPALPDFLGNTALLTCEDCDDCRALVGESLEELDQFTRPFRQGTTDVAGPPPPIPLVAYKGLTRMALTILPLQELQYFGDALEWVGNPDHDFDAASFADLTCVIGLLPDPAPFSWAALARRKNDDAPLPYLLFFLGTGHASFQVRLPHCVLDEDLDGDRIIVPRVATPFGPGPRLEERACLVAPVAPAACLGGVAGRR